jgi:hypothetical protein
MRLSSVIRWLLLVPCAVAAWYFAVVVSVVLREIVVGRCLGSDAPLPEYLVSAQILGLRATFPRCRLICGSCGRGRGCGGSFSQIACRLGRSGRRRNTGDRHGVQYRRRRGSSRGHSFRCSGRCCHASHYHRIARCKCRTYERRAKRITSSWSGPSYVVAATSRARHFIMRSRRASDGSVRPLNCGVRRHGDHMSRFTLVAVVLILAGCAQDPGYEPRNGDIVFQTSRSSQSLAIQLATKSPYSHMGIVYLRDGEPFVFEAVQPVKLTPLRTWIERGDRKHFVAKRLREADSRLTPETLQKMRAAGEQLSGKDYDLYFEWSDDRIYCSELVWKVFERGAGIRLGAQETIADFDLSHPAVQAKVKERYGDQVPLDEVVVSPVAIFNATDLMTVYEN